MTTKTEEKKDEAKPAEEPKPEAPKETGPKPGAIVRDEPASRALAPLPTYGTLTLEPTTFSEAKTLATYAADSGLFGVKSAPGALMRLMRGRELGLGAATSLDKIFEVEAGGVIRLGMYADVILALTRKHPNCEYIELIETTATKCVMVGKRVGAKHETKIEWTIERAERADLIDRGTEKGTAKRNNWNRYPENMLRARATSELCKIVCPEATMGIDSIEVMRDERDRERTITVTPEGDVLDVGPKAKGRDYEREVDALKLEISGAKTEADKEAVIARIKAADLPEHHHQAVKEAYAAKYAKRPGAPAPGSSKPATAPTAAPQKPGREPGDD